MYPSEVLIKARHGDVNQLHGYKSFIDMVEACNGFAQVFPEHKHEIVKILKEANHVVGMTGVCVCVHVLKKGILECCCC